MGSPTRLLRKSFEALHQSAVEQSGLIDFGLPVLMQEIIADEVDECINVLRQKFVSNHFAEKVSAVSYDYYAVRRQL